ncbi:MAG TPA: EamA family transporter [Clostridia bacterium]|nr:EamA family transporter [Clostridia bacterium]
MEPAIIALVAASAVLHVGWNVRIKTAGDPLVAATIGLVAGALVIVPLGFGWWLAGGARSLPADGLALGLLSGLFEAIYFVLLAAAYRRGDLSLVYPIARGTAPLLLVAVGVVLLGERLGELGWLGVGGLFVGFFALQRPWAALRRGASVSGAVPFALATGVAIAAYTSVDRVGTRIIEPVPYAALLWLSGSVLLVLWVIAREGRAVLRPARAVVRHASVGGLMTLAAYLLILVALSVAPLTAVAPLRESSTVLAAAWGAVRLGEAVGRRDAARRIAASGLIVGGAILLALDA